MANTAKKSAPKLPVFVVARIPATRAETQNNNQACWDTLAVLLATGPQTKAALIASLKANASLAGNGAYVGYAIRRGWLAQA